jgi:hypothetical protein
MMRGQIGQAKPAFKIDQGNAAEGLKRKGGVFRMRLKEDARTR